VEEVAMSPVVPGLEIGGTHVTVALIEMEPLRVVAGSRNREPLVAAAGAEAILESIVRCARTLDDAVPAGTTWGVAIPGPFDYASGIGRFSGVAKFEALNGVDVGRALLERLPRAAQVTFLNDADASLLGEWAAGAAAGHDRAAGITLGTGIGSAFLADGQLVETGPDVPPEGRADLLTIDGRPLEETVSRRAILARYAELAPASAAGLDVHDVAARARAGDTVARGVFDAALSALGSTLAPWLDRFGATVLVVGGSMSGSWDLVEPPLRAGLGGRIELVPAANSDDAALIGAAWHASGLAGETPTRQTGDAAR
jgi:glucokinase